MNRSTMKTLCTCLSLVIFCACSSLAAEGEKPKSSVIMEKKLEYSQQLLSAMITEDFTAAERDIKLLKTFTRLEEMYRGKRPEYRAQLTKFQDSITAISKAVDDKNLDEMSRGYADMVQSCVKCHEILRSK